MEPRPIPNATPAVLFLPAGSSSFADMCTWATLYRHQTKKNTKKNLIIKGTGVSTGIGVGDAGGSDGTAFIQGSVQLPEAVGAGVVGAMGWSGFSRGGAACVHLWWN